MKVDLTIDILINPETNEDIEEQIRINNIIGKPTMLPRLKDCTTKKVYIADISSIEPIFDDEVEYCIINSYGDSFTARISLKDLLKQLGKNVS